MIRSNGLSWLCLVAIVSFVGCSGGSGLETVPVSGVVTLDSQPVEGATVSFSPKSEGGVAAAGITDASGHFTLATTSGEGAAPGAYAVTISKASAGGAQAFQDPRSSGGNLSQEDMKAMSDIARQQAGARPGSAAPAKSAVPEKYASADTSGFAAEVKSGEKNEFSFDMKSE
jgi:hypothetical protein